MFYVITFSNGGTKYLEATNWLEADDWANYYADCIHDWDYTVEEYDSEEQYLENYLEDI